MVGLVFGRPCFLRSSMSRSGKGKPDSLKTQEACKPIASSDQRTAKLRLNDGEATSRRQRGSEERGGRLGGWGTLRAERGDSSKNGVPNRASGTQRGPTSRKGKKTTTREEARTSTEEMRNTCPKEKNEPETRTFTPTQKSATKNWGNIVWV